MTNSWSAFMLGLVWLAGLAGAGEAADLAVSYTHLTLPTKLEV